LDNEFNADAAKSLLPDERYKSLVAFANLGQFQLVQIYNQLIQLMDETILMIEA
jgi:hypothetical protein